MRRRLGFALAAAFAAGGCSLSGLFDAAALVVPAVIVTSSGDTIRLVLPDTVAVGTPLQVRFSSFGTCRTIESSRTDVAFAAADIIAILPYDREATTPCGGDALKLFVHDVSLTFTTTGRKVIQIVGERGVFEGVRPQAFVERVVTVR